MRHITPTFSLPRFTLAALAVGLCTLAGTRLLAADDAKKAATPTGLAGSPDAKGSYFEMRIYTAAPGKMDALQKRFREHTLKLFEKHGIRNVGYWTAVDDKHQGKFYFIIGYPDKASRDKMWNAFANDPEWLKAKEASEKDGKLVDAVEQVFMAPADYSPIR